MKRIIVAIIVLMTVNHCYSQAYLSFGTKAFSAHPFYFSLGGGYVFNNGIVLDMEGKLPVSQRIDLATNLSGSVGYVIPLNSTQDLSVTPMVGESLNYRNNDKKSLNTWSSTGAIRLTYKSLYVQPACIEEQLYLGIGIIANLNRRR